MDAFVQEVQSRTRIPELKSTWLWRGAVSRFHELTRGLHADHILGCSRARSFAGQQPRPRAEIRCAPRLSGMRGICWPWMRAPASLCGGEPCWWGTLAAGGSPGSFITHPHTITSGFPFFIPAFIPGNVIGLWQRHLQAQLSQVLESQMNPIFSPIQSLKNLNSILEFPELAFLVRTAVRTVACGVDGSSACHGQAMGLRVTENGRACCSLPTALRRRRRAGVRSGVLCGRRRAGA